MGERSAQKRQLIVDAARRVFAEKGYKDVTMTDIVEACGISRGGLYLYFDSTRELFLEVMRAEEGMADDVFSGQLAEDAAAVDVLMIFFREQKREILGKKGDLSMAVYEYCFAGGGGKEEPSFKRRFESGLRALERLIEAGIEDGSFYEVDVRAAARNIMYALEGLRICSRTMGLTEAAVDEELLALAGGLVAE